MVVASIASRAGVLADVAWPALVAPLSAPWPAGALTGSVALRGAATVLAWGLAGILSALGARRGTRLGALTGAAAGLVVCAAALGPWMTVGSRMEPAALLQMGAASILIVVIVALGPPVHAGDTGDRDVETSR
jgi:hypothetical protein